MPLPCGHRIGSVIFSGSIIKTAMRAEKILASSIQVWCETSWYGEDPYHYISASLNFECATNVIWELTKAAYTTLCNCYQKRNSFMKGGLMLCNLSEEVTQWGNAREITRWQNDAI